MSSDFYAMVCCQLEAQVFKKLLNCYWHMGRGVLRVAQGGGVL